VMAQNDDVLLLIENVAITRRDIVHRNVKRAAEARGLDLPRFSNVDQDNVRPVVSQRFQILRCDLVIQSYFLLTCAAIFTSLSTSGGDVRETR